MNKLYYKLFMALFLAVAISGCKLDPPIYPEGTVANPGAKVVAVSFQPAAL
jgi:hypothetical protein